MTPPDSRSAVRAMEPVYLDHAAATPLLPEVAAAMEAVRAAGFANPSSPHAAGRRARRLLEDARERIVALVGGDLGAMVRLVFTSGATEANRLGILGLAGVTRGRIFVSPRDHAGVAAVAAGRTTPLPLRAAGTLDLAGPAARGAYGPGDVLCITLVCGQSGAREDMERVAAWAAACPTRRVHVDATQAFLGADAATPFGIPPGVAATLAFAPHKFGGPRGIGGLLVRGGVTVAPEVPGAQEGGLRGGTEPVDLAVGFARAVEMAVADRVEVARRVATLRDGFETRVVAAARSAGITARVVAENAPRAPHIATIAFLGIDRQALVMAADLEGVCAATGTACASGSSEPAPALVAMGLPAAEVASAVRFSLGRTTTPGDIDAALERLGRVFARLATTGAG